MKPRSYLLQESFDGKKTEMDTISCAHCQTMIILLPTISLDDLGSYCAKCNKHICKRCTRVGECLPWEKQLEKIEKVIDKDFKFWK